MARRDVQDDFPEKFVELLGNAVEAAKKRQEQDAPKLFWGQRPSASDYGLSEKNPICSSSLTGTTDYLSNLRTKDGQKFTWKGYTSLRTDCNGVKDIGIDKYDLYLNGNFYTSVYFAPYSGDSPFPPAGLYFADSMRDFATARKAFENNPTSVEACFKLDDEAEKESNVEIPSDKYPTIKVTNPERSFGKIICNRCGRTIPDDSLFCPFCGNSVSNFERSSLDKAFISGEENNAPSKKEITAIPQAEKSSEITKKHRRKPSVAIIVLSVFLMSFAGLNIYQYMLFQENNLKVQEMGTEIASLKNANTKLEKQKKDAESAKIEAIRQKNKAIRENQTFETIRTWVERYSKSFHSHSSYYAASNTIAVKKGETLDLIITYTGSRNVWLQKTNNNCKTEWSSSWSGNTTKLRIAGVSEGTTELIFSLGDSSKSDSQESFRVLVIVV